MYLNGTRMTLVKRILTDYDFWFSADPLESV